MDLDIIHTDLFFLANKEQNFWPRKEVDNALAFANTWCFNDWYSRYAVDQESLDALSPFKIKHTFTIASTSGGIIDLTGVEYQHLLSLYVSVYNNKKKRQEPTDVRLVNEDELPSRLRSQLKPVGITTPVATISTYGTIQLYPEVPNTGYAFLLAKPERPHYNYKMVGRKQVYNAANSTQMKWGENYILQIIIKALQYLAVNIENDRLKQYTELKDQQKL